MKYVIFFFSVLISLQFFSCKKIDDVCLQNKSVRLNIGFYSYTTDSIPVKKAVTVNALTVILASALDKDSLYNKTASSSVQLPLNGGTSSTRFGFFFTATQAAADSLIIYHHSTPQFISQACGYVYNFEIDSIHVIPFNIDSALLKNPTVEINKSNENIQIIL